MGLIKAPFSSEALKKSKEKTLHKPHFYIKRKQIKGKGAKIATVNLKMCNYNSGKLKGVKLYTVNQNRAKLGKCAKIVIVNLNARFPDVAPPSVNDVSYI